MDFVPAKIFGGHSVYFCLGSDNTDKFHFFYHCSHLLIRHHHPPNGSGRQIFFYSVCGQTIPDTFDNLDYLIYLLFLLI